MTTKYLFLLRSSTEAPRPQQKPSPAEMQAAMEQWNAWRTKFKDEIVDMGDQLTQVGAVCSSTAVTDGPYVEGKEVIGGYMIVATSSLDRAIQIAKEGPMAQAPGVTIEIRALAGRSG